jgi:hypothetical protein
MASTSPKTGSLRDRIPATVGSKEYEPGIVHGNTQPSAGGLTGESDVTDYKPNPLAS